MVTEHFPKFSETFFVDKFLRLVERGWDVHVVCSHSDPAQLEFFPHVADHVAVGDRIHVTGDVDAQVVALEPDVLHFEYGTLARGRMYLRELCGCAVVVSFRGYDINYAGLEDPEWYSDVWAGADLLHLVSDDIWARARRRGCPTDKAHVVVRDAVDTLRLVPPQRMVPDAIGTSERPLRVLSVGRLHWKKGHEYAVEALARLRDEGIHWQYRIVGEGDHRDAVAFAAHDLGVQDRVELIGAQDRAGVEDAMRWADLFVHPSVSEGFCVAAAEAQAMALPVVASDADGLPENVAHDETGFVVPRRDAIALADRITALARDPGRLAAMGAAARARAERQLDVHAQIDEFDAVYERLRDGLKLRDRTNAGASRATAPDPLTGLAESLPPPGGEEAVAAPPAALPLLHAHLRRLDAQAQGLRDAIWRREATAHIAEAIAESVPEGARVLVVSKGDDALLELPGRQAHHFPLAPDGAYAGFHPADGRQALEHLDALRRVGADYIAFPAPSFWWLDHYDELREFLENEAFEVPAHSSACRVFGLRPAVPAHSDVEPPQAVGRSVQWT